MNREPKPTIIVLKQHLSTPTFVELPVLFHYVWIRECIEIDSPHGLSPIITPFNLYLSDSFLHVQNI